MVLNLSYKSQHYVCHLMNSELFFFIILETSSCSDQQEIHSCLWQNTIFLFLLCNINDKANVPIMQKDTYVIILTIGFLFFFFFFRRPGKVSRKSIGLSTTRSWVQICQESPKLHWVVTLTVAPLYQGVKLGPGSDLSNQSWLCGSLCTSDCRWWCFHPNCKTHGRSQQGSETETTSVRCFCLVWGYLTYVAWSIRLANVSGSNCSQIMVNADGKQTRKLTM